MLTAEEYSNVSGHQLRFDPSIEEIIDFAKEYAKYVVNQGTDGWCVENYGKLRPGTTTSHDPKDHLVYRGVSVVKVKLIKIEE